MRMNNIQQAENGAIILANVMAAWKHRNQVRKYTGEPYVVHCIEVAQILHKVKARANVIIAGLLHDTIEDTDMTAEEIAHYFGDEVARLVLEVTDVSKPEDGNREFRKAIDRDHIAKASRDGQLIKLADLISNTKSIVARDPGFAEIYLAEKRKLLAVMDNTLPLWKEAAALAN